MQKKDIELLVEFHERFNEPETEISFIPNRWGRTIKGKIRYPRDSEKLTKKEIMKIIEIVQNNDDAKFYPINFNFGFYPSYVVGNDNKEFLRFSDCQTPKGFDFDELSKYFNVEGTNKIIRDKESYYY